MEPHKAVNTLVLDTGPIIKNEPSVSTLLAHAQDLITVPSVIDEIKDAATRSRLETTLRPFLVLREPSVASVKFVQDFARKTGDLSVLSKTDIQLLALTYELECEKNGGDWRLRRVPGQKKLNGAPPKAPETTEKEGQPGEQDSVGHTHEIVSKDADEAQILTEPGDGKHQHDMKASENAAVESIEAKLSETHLDDSPRPQSSSIAESTSDQPLHDVDRPNYTPFTNSQDTQPTPPANNLEASPVSDSDSDSEGWITPSNIHKHIAADSSASTTAPEPPNKTLQVALLSTDFAMQNVALLINLNLLSPSLARVRHLKTFIKRCHACFLQVKDVSKVFCPRCGKDTLTKVSCSTTQDGEFRLHLKRNMQWNNRGNRFSVPKPVAGSAGGKSATGGGKGGWGQGLILAEDQKEYTRALRQDKKAAQRDLMDEDFLPSLLAGKDGKGRAGGRDPVQVGMGRNVNGIRRR